MGFRLVASSSDAILEADGPDLGAALVEAAKGFTHVTTHGAPVEGREARPIDVASGADLAGLAAAFVNQLVFLFSTEGFLPATGRLAVETGARRSRVHGELRGEPFDRGRHQIGTEVKAATLHEAAFRMHAGKARLRLLLDL